MTPSAGQSRSERFLQNVLWSWMGVAVTVFVGFILSPYIIHKIGDDNFGLWALVLSLTDYYWLLDLGFRSATLQFAARYRAAGESDKVNEVMNTAIVYSSVVGLVLLVLTWTLAPHVGGWFHIDQPVFRSLVLIVGTCWALGMVFNAFGAGLEGFQRFDISSRIWILTTGLRSAGIAFALFLGYGLVQMAFLMLGSQLLAYFLNYLSFIRTFPQARLSWRMAKLRMLREMARFGIHSFTVSVSQRLLNQGAPLLIGYFLPVRFVGYYNVPCRVLDYAMDGIGRVGMVTTPNATELYATRESKSLAELGAWANRYCLALYLPLTIFLLVYGRPLMEVWITPEFARHSAGLFPILLAGMTAVAAQYNSISILFGIGRHQTYARSLLLEGTLVMVGLAVVLPRFGLPGAAWVLSVLMLVNRGCWAGVLLCRQLRIPLGWYASRIYTAPLLIAAPIFLLLDWLHAGVLPGKTWLQLGAAAAIMGILLSADAFFFVLKPAHRATLVAWAAQRLTRTGMLT